MKKILFLFLIAFLTSCTTKVVTENDVRGLMEKAYFEGQKDALNGLIRIEMQLSPNNKDSMYVWVISPWDDGAEPRYIPNVTDSKPTKMNITNKTNINYK